MSVTKITAIVKVVQEDERPGIIKISQTYETNI